VAVLGPLGARLQPRSGSTTRRGLPRAARSGSRPPATIGCRRQWSTPTRRPRRVRSRSRPCARRARWRGTASRYLQDVGRPSLSSPGRGCRGWRVMVVPTRGVLQPARVVTLVPASRAARASQWPPVANPVLGCGTGRGLHEGDLAGGPGRADVRAEQRHHLAGACRPASTADPAHSHVRPETSVGHPDGRLQPGGQCRQPGTVLDPYPDDRTEGTCAREADRRGGRQPASYVSGDPSRSLGGIGLTEECQRDVPPFRWLPAHVGSSGPCLIDRGGQCVPHLSVRPDRDEESGGHRTIIASLPTRCRDCRWASPRI